MSSDIVLTYTIFCFVIKIIEGSQLNFQLDMSGVFLTNPAEDIERVRNLNDKKPLKYEVVYGKVNVKIY